MEEEEAVMEEEEEAQKPVIGFGNASQQIDYCVAVEKGIKEAWANQGWEVVALNTELDGQKALEATDTFIEMQVDVIDMWNVDAGVNDAISEKVIAAGIPTIAHEYALPNIPFFGADNAAAGRLTGRTLAEKAVEIWDGEVDLILLIGLPDGGESMNARIWAIPDGIADVLGDISNIPIIEVDGENIIEAAQIRTVDTLTANPDKIHILIGTLNDENALGAFNAAVAANRLDEVIIHGHGGDAPIITHLINDPVDNWLGSTAYFPENHGNALVPMIDAILKGEEVPDPTYFPIEPINKDNILDYYKIEDGEIIFVGGDKLS